LDGHLIHQTLFVGVIKMENKVVSGQWLGPVSRWFASWIFVWSSANPVFFLESALSFFGISSRNSQETNSK
jgi:hypothetical protein